MENVRADVVIVTPTTIIMSISNGILSINFEKKNHASFQIHTVPTGTKFLQIRIYTESDRSGISSNSSTLNNARKFKFSAGLIKTQKATSEQISTY